MSVDPRPTRAGSIARAGPEAQRPKSTPSPAPGRTSTRRRVLLAGYGVGNALLAATYVLLPTAKVVAWTGIVLSCLVAIGVGLSRNKPRRRLPWLLLGGGYLTFAAGTVTAFVATPVLGVDASSWADIIFLTTSFPLLLGGLVSLTQSRATISGRASVIDSAILTIGTGFLTWVFLIEPFLRNPDLSTVEKALSVAYPLSDVLILTMLVRFAVSAVRSWTVRLLLLSVSALLTSDALYGMNRLNGDWQVGGPIDIGWLLFYIAGGAAALHPSMVQLTEPWVRARTQAAVGRTVLTVMSLVAPVVLFVEAMRGPVHDGALIAAVSTVLILLSLARMSTAAADLHQALGRERQLRRACETLLSSGTRNQVTGVVHDAVAHLLAPGTRHHIVVHTPDSAAGGSGALPDSDGSTDDASAEPIRVCYVRDLPPSVAVQLADFELALRCLMAVGDRPTGALYVAADEDALLSLREALPILVGQAATMLRHIDLTREINRRDSQAFFHSLVLNATDVILIVDDDNLVTYASPAARRVFGSADLVGTPAIEVVEPAQRDEASAALAEARTGLRQEFAMHWTVRRAARGQVAMDVAIRNLRHEPTVGGLVLTLHDVTEERRLQQELLERAYLDPLTGLGNRLRFQDTVAQVAADATRDGTIAGVLLLNIDDFRTVNDIMGQDVGDGLLVAVGRHLAATLAGDGTVARLGADEFGAVVTGAHDIGQIERLVETVMAATAEPYLVAGSVITTRLSIGVSTTADAVDGQQLLSQADVALANAKSAGKARWRRYEASLHSEVLSRMQLRADLDRAVIEENFTLVYQPIVDLRTGRTHGMEALVRWPHPTRGVVVPTEFIPVAEETGLIVPLGAWVLRTAVSTAAGWHARSPGEAPYVSVNVSVRQFRTPGFVEQVFAELAASGLPARHLTLEITESLLLGEHDRIHADVGRLRQAGIKVSIDDFGTGYSSLSYLHRVQVDTLKLDKSFVDTITTSSRQLNLVRGIIQLADTLQLQVVAEGVEEPAARALLIESGCGFGQGYLFARPLSEQATDIWLAADPAVPADPGTGQGGSDPLSASRVTV